LFKEDVQNVPPFGSSACTQTLRRWRHWAILSSVDYKVWSLIQD